MTDFLIFLVGFLFNFLIALILVRLIYYPSTHNKRYVFTFLAFNTVIYFVLSFLTSIELSIGAGFGLFAIFSILRYRTDPLPVREMTYLFVIVALPVMNSVSSNMTLWPHMIAANLLVLLVMFILEKEWGFHYENSKQITYEKIELIRPENFSQLKADLETRTGLSIKRINIGRLNFLKDTANVTIYYNPPAKNGWSNEDESLIQIIDKDDSD
jgi:hypothetical protein